MLTGFTYYMTVTATDTDGISGTSPLREFDILLSPPETISGMGVTPVGGV